MSERESNPQCALVTRLLPLLFLLTLPSLSQAQFTFATNSDGLSLTLTKYSGPGGAVVIPATTNGLPVETIWKNAFSGTNVTSVSVPNSVTGIGAWAFAGCSSLSNITIPNSVTNIGEFAFYHAGLTNITLGNHVASVGRFAFALCWGMNDVTFPASVTNIGSYLFKDCTNISGVYFKGNAPNHGFAVFSGRPPMKVYYVAGTTGWGPTFIGRPTALWQPEHLPEK